MVSTAAGVMKQSMIANSSELEGRAIPCVNIVCITDAGKKMHFGQATCGYDQFERLLKVEQMGGRRKTSNKILETPELGFVRLGTYHLHDVSFIFSKTYFVSRNLNLFNRMPMCSFGTTRSVSMVGDRINFTR